MKPEDFECERCGACCEQIVLLTDSDIRHITDLGYSEEDFVMRSPFRKDKGKKCIKLVNNKCFFLENADGKVFCKIYRHRPKTCRIYPFFSKEIEDCKPRDYYFFRAIKKKNYQSRSVRS